MAKRTFSQSYGTLGFVIIAIIVFAAPVFATYSLVWSDEFNGSSLDPGNWTADVGNGCPSLCGWGNGELEYYRTQNVSVSGGNLILTTLAQSYGGSSYTSGKVHTRGKQSFLYGRIEMRAKIPTGEGMWPAFWMMPQDDVYGGWAASGEIDIMESANGTTSVGGALHFGGSWPDNTSTGGSYSLGGSNFADDFHIYAVEWEPDAIRWYVDGALFSTRTSSQWYSDGAPGNPRAPFDQDFYIILNAAVGGYYTGCTSTSCVTASFPQQYLIDYVRVYSDIPNLTPTVSITSPAADATLPAGDITITAIASDADGSVATVEFYDGATYLGEDTTFPYSLVWAAVADGCYTITARAIDDLGGVETDAVDITVGLGCGQRPYLGDPFVLPARIEAEDYDIGGEGIAYHDLDSGNNGSQYRLDENVDIEACSDVGGGYNAGWARTDEWLEYTVNVPVSGEYVIESRVASLSNGGTFHLDFNGVNETGDVIVPVTGGWQTWTTVSAPAILTAGLQTMRFTVTAEGFNINYFDIQSPMSAVQPGIQSAGFALHPCYPNPFNPKTTISYSLSEPGQVNLTIYNVSGHVVKALVSTYMSAGPGTVEWNGTDTSGKRVASGTYFLRLETDQGVRTRKLMLAK